MAKKYFSPEELDTLRQCPHVTKVIGNRITFTPAFKKMAYQQMIDGKSLRTIFVENGIDPDILGESRIWGFAQKLRENADREGGFEDLRAKNKRNPAADTREQSLSKRVAALEHELAYTRQEVELLKKIHVADLEARKQWESKQRRK